MKRSKFTYGQLDRVLRSLGFKYRPSKDEPPGRVYQHQAGAMIVLPALPDNAKVYEIHMVSVRGELDNFGIADPTAFDAKIQKAG